MQAGGGLDRQDHSVQKLTAGHITCTVQWNLHMDVMQKLGLDFAHISFSNLAFPRPTPEQLLAQGSSDFFARAGARGCWHSTQHEEHL